MHMNIRATGSSFVASAAIEHNPRDLVLKLIAANPKATRQELFPQFRELLSGSEDAYQRAVDYYFFTNMFAQITDPRPTTGHQRRATIEDVKAETTAREVEEILVDRIKAQIVLLDLTMPNGKAMRDCTGAEMAKFGNRYQRIAEKVGKTKLVGAVLDEAAVRNIMA